MSRPMTEEVKNKIAYAQELHAQGLGFNEIRKKVRERHGTSLNNNRIAAITTEASPGALSQQEKAENVKIGRSKRNANARARERQIHPDLRPAPLPAPANLIDGLRAVVLPFIDKGPGGKIEIYQDATGMIRAKVTRMVVDDFPLGPGPVAPKARLRVVNGASKLPFDEGLGNPRL